MKTSTSKKMAPGALDLRERFRRFAIKNFLCAALKPSNTAVACTLAIRHEGPHSWFEKEPDPFGLDDEPAAVEEQPEIPAEPRRGTWARLNGEWHVRMLKKGSRPGDVVEVVRQDGQKKLIELGQEIRRNVFEVSAEIVDVDRPKNLVKVRPPTKG